MPTSMESQFPSQRALRSTEQQELLDLVDSLRDQGLGEVAALPQLIVCGDQSGAKSSILEAISGIPFTRQENGSTLFATEIILRKYNTTSISVSIVPARLNSSNTDQLLRFKRRLQTPNDFPQVYKEAQSVMRPAATGRAFSRDILRVEYRGPNQPQLTLIDLPGLIRPSTGSPAADVDQFVSHYLENPRSIILAVVSTNSDTSNQLVIKQVRDVDPLGSRTLGIVTKPDNLLRSNPDTGKSRLGITKNDEVAFRLGWHTVKSSDSPEGSAENGMRGNQDKAYFTETNFQNSPSNTIGVTSFKMRLSIVLFQHIRNELPRLVDDIESRMNLIKQTVDKLGPSRKTVDEQRLFLIQLSQSFQLICRDAIRGHYDHGFFSEEDDPQRRFYEYSMNMQFEFSTYLQYKGASWNIVDGENHDPQCRTRQQAVEDIYKFLKRSRERQPLVLPHSVLVAELFREYSRPWESLSKDYIKRVWDATMNFLELVLNHLSDDDTRQRILRLWIHSIMEERLSIAYGKLEELLELYKDYPNARTQDSVEARKQYQHRKIYRDLEQGLEGLAQDRKASSIASAVALRTGRDRDLVEAEAAFDNMQAYYKVALDLFTENVQKLVIQSSIVSNLDEILCPTAVFSMSPELVEKITRESSDQISKREQLSCTLSILQSGATTCKQYAT